jgi:hypothetical protein
MEGVQTIQVTLNGRCSTVHLCPKCFIKQSEPRVGLLARSVAPSLTSSLTGHQGPLLESTRQSRLQAIQVLTMLANWLHAQASSDRFRPLIAANTLDKKGITWRITRRTFARNRAPIDRLTTETTESGTKDKKSS